MSNKSESAISSNNKQQSKSSDDASCWSLEDVGKWLEECNLGQYAQKFHENEIDGSILVSDGLDDSLVKDLIPNIKHRVIFNAARNKLLKSVKSTSEIVEQTTAFNNASGVTRAPVSSNWSSSILNTDQTFSGSSLSDLLGRTDPEEERKKYMDRIQKDYTTHGKFKVARAQHKNIMLIGRTRTGKSTIKSLLVDPTEVPDEISLKSGTKDPLFEAFHVSDNRMVLNIIDTPGLFERGAKQLDLRDNQTIMNTIEICANREITMFHVICFCVAITVGINQEDIESLKLLVKFLGKEVSSNSCLIVTHCESKNKQQRANIETELKEDVYFQEIASFFKLGIFFSGSLNRDDYNNGNDNLLKQFVTVSDYRQKLIELFTSDIKPFPISEMVISAIRRSHDEATIKATELTEMKARAEAQAGLIENLKAAHIGEQQDTAGLIAALVESIEYGHKELNRLRAPGGDINNCPIS